MSGGFVSSSSSVSLFDELVRAARARVSGSSRACTCALRNSPSAAKRSKPRCSSRSCAACSSLASAGGADLAARPSVLRDRTVGLLAARPPSRARSARRGAASARGSGGGPGRRRARAASSRFVSGSSDSPSACSTFSRNGWPSALSCSGRSSSRTSRGGGLGLRLRHPAPQSRRCGARRGRPRRARREPDEARGHVRVDISRRRPGRPPRPSSAPVTRKTIRLGRAERRQRHRHPVDEGLEPGRPADRAPVARRRAAASRGRATPCARPAPRPSSRRSSVDALERRVELGGGLVGRQLAADPVHLARRPPRAGRAASPSRAGSSSARRPAARSARRPTRA